MIFLACDIGNSFTKFTFFNENTIIRKFSCSNSEISSLTFNDLKFDKAAISSVVPEITKILCTIFVENGYQPFLITNKSILNFSIDYETPETLGIDRICSTAGVLSLIETGEIENLNKFLFADLGTATTINLIGNRVFTGGIIAPGIMTMTESLNFRTAQLPLIDLKAYSGIIGKSTQSAISSGVINSTIGLIEKVYSSIFSDNVHPIILSGGNAKIILKYLKIPFILIEDAVAIGIKKIAELNQ